MSDMRIVIVPKSLQDEIYKLLDAAYVNYPEAAVDRECHYQTLLNFYADNGYLPDFKLWKKESKE